MAKLVDALCLGLSARKGVLVRIQFWAPMNKSLKFNNLRLFSFNQFLLFCVTKLKSL